MHEAISLLPVLFIDPAKHLGLQKLNIYLAVDLNTLRNDDQGCFQAIVTHTSPNHDTCWMLADKTCPQAQGDVFNVGTIQTVILSIVSLLHGEYLFVCPYDIGARTCFEEGFDFFCLVSSSSTLWPQKAPASSRIHSISYLDHF